MLGLPAIVARLQGRQINLRQEVMIADTEATDFGDPVLLRLFVSLGGHGGTPSMQWAKSAKCFWPHGSLRMYDVRRVPPFAVRLYTVAGAMLLRRRATVSWLYSSGHTEPRAIVTLERCVR